MLSLKRKSGDMQAILLEFLALGVGLLLISACTPPRAAAQLGPTETPFNNRTVSSSQAAVLETGTPFSPPVTPGASAPTQPLLEAGGTSTAQEQRSPTATPRLPSPTPNYTPTPDTRPTPNNWRTWPVIPAISQHAIDIYQQGLVIGNDPHAFSIIGDCQSEPAVFMGIYDSDRYYLGEDYTYLQDTIDQYAGNFGRENATTRNGLSVASVFSPLWAPKDICQLGETPLDCEFRLHKPSIVFINLGTNWKDGDGYTHQVYLRELVDYVIAKGALPILSTKADNHEGDNSINLTTAQVAYDYDIPLWNFWASVQSLPNHGLDKERKDNNYLTVDAWSVRGFTGLLALDRAWRKVNGLEIP
jgi:hypothetical protein